MLKTYWLKSKIILVPLLNAVIETNSGEIKMLRSAEAQLTEVISREAPVHYGRQHTLEDVVVVRHWTIKDRRGLQQARRAVDIAIDSTASPSRGKPNLQITTSLIKWVPEKNSTSQRRHSLRRSICSLDSRDIMPRNGVGQRATRRGQLEEVSTPLRSSSHLWERCLHLIK